jgi:3-hydroxyacyl-CoA dehydrogenase
MAKLTRRPKAEDSNITAIEKPDRNVDRMADAFINKGGKSLVSSSQEQVIRGRISEQSDPEAKIGITVKLLVKERNTINQLRKERPTRSQVSLHDWIIEAVQEKLKKEAE